MTKASLDVELHQPLGHELHHLAQHVDVGSLLGELGQCHSGGGHRGYLLGTWLVGRTSTISGTTMATPTGIALATRQAASGYALRALPRRRTYTTSWDINHSRPFNRTTTCFYRGEQVLQFSFNLSPPA